MSVSFSAMNPALRLISSSDGIVKVYIDDSKFAGLTGNSSLSGCDAGTITSVSLFVKQADKPYKFWSNTLNGIECIYDDQGVLRIVSEVAILDPKNGGYYKLSGPASYSAILTLKYGATTKSITGDFTVVGDMITPEIRDIRQGAANGATRSLKLKIYPNNFENPLLSPLVTSNLSKVTIVKDGVMLGEVDYEADGVYEVTGLTVNQEYSFAVIMSSKGGHLSEISDSFTGTPVNTPDATAPTGVSGLSGDYFINIASQTRAALAAGATDAERDNDYLTQLDVYAYEHAADDLSAATATVPESMYRKIGTVQRVVNADKSSTIPASQLRVEGAFNGRYVRHFARASNGYGQGKSVTGAAFRVEGAVSAPIVACSLLSDHKYEIAVQPGAAVTGFTLIGHKVEVKARSVSTWGASVGTFSELTDAKDTWSIVDGIAHLRAIEKVTSSNKANTSDVVSHKAVSKVNFQLTTIGSFDVRVTSIYEKTRELTQVLPLGAVVLGSDLRGAEDGRKLVYGTAATLFADATAGKNILVHSDLSTPTLLENVVTVAVISTATWPSAAAATFVSASGDSATYSMSMDKFNLLALTIDTVACSYDTHTVKYSIMKKGVYPQYSEIASLDGTYFDQASLKKQFIIARGEKSEVGVQVSVYKLGKLVAQSALSTFITLIPSGQGAYSGLAVMTHADQGVVDYVTTDVKSVLNRAAAVTLTDANSCEAKIALEGSPDASIDARMNHPAFLAAGWSRATKIYKLDEVTGLEIAGNLVVAVAEKTFTETGKPNRLFKVHTLTGLTAMKSYSYRVHRDWEKGAEILLDTEPITFTVTPTIAVQKRDVVFVAGNGAVNCSFKLSNAAETNGEEQKKAIKALGGVFNAVLVKNAAGKYDQLEQSSSAHFTSPIANGHRILGSRAQYLNPNFGAQYSIDERWVMSATNESPTLVFGPGPAQLNATVESGKNLAGEHGCLFTFDAPAADHTVTIRAVHDDASHLDADKHVELFTNLTGTKHFIKHSDIIAFLGHTAAKYHGHGVTFLVGHKHTATSVESLPKALFHMPKGQTTFVAGNFDVKSGAKQLTIKYNVTDADAKAANFAGHSVIPATITYTESAIGHIQTLRVADITSANGVVISGLDDARTYTISIAIEGNATAVLTLGDKSPAASPNAVANLKVEQVANDPTTLKVTFAASQNNGEYNTVAYKAYVSTMVNGVKRYLSADTGALAAVSDGKVGFTHPNNDVLSGLTAGSLYDVEIESTFAATGVNTAQVVSAFAQGTPSAKAEIKDFRLDTKNYQARLIVDLKGSKLNTLLLLTNSGSALNIDLANAAVAQSKLGQINLNIAVPAVVTNVVAIVANSNGVVMRAANATQGDATTATNAGLYNAVTSWVNL